MSSKITSESGESGWGALFEQLKTQEGFKSDAALAQSLGVTRSFISAVRKNRKSMPTELGETIFALLRKPIIEEYTELFKPLRVQRASGARQISPQTKALIMSRAGGKCELCEGNAPFITAQGDPYLEMHYIVPVVFGGTAKIDNLVALCPNCHRKVELLPSENDKKTLQERARRTKIL